MSTPKKKGTSGRWDAKGIDVPGGRFGRALRQGLGGLNKAEQKKAKRARYGALDRFRAAARDLQGSDRNKVWALIPLIGRKGYPTWDEVVAARSRSEILTLALRGEVHAETDARRARGAQNSERRTCLQGIDEYLRWQEHQDFAPDTTITATSVLRRAQEVESGDGEMRYADRRVSSLTRSDGTRILEAFLISDRTKSAVQHSTSDKHRKVLKAWFQYELQKEQDRAEDQGRPQLFSVNVFSESGGGYSSPSKDAKKTLADVGTRRFFPDEMGSLLEVATGAWYYILAVVRRLGLRPGETTHIRWLDDVIPLPDGRGYEIRLEGGRGRDHERCGCPQCRSKRGWAPKNGPRRYILDRENDAFGWMKDVCDALDAWLMIRNPARGEFIFPDPDDWTRALTNGKLNKGLHAVAVAAGVVTGMGKRGSRTFHSLRHTCASELLEAGITHHHAAYWIGDTPKEFMKTYGRPTDQAMARAIFGRVKPEPARQAGVHPSGPGA